MQIDNNASATSNGAIFELWSFDGDDDQRWRLAYVSDGYYKIVCVASGKVATAPDSTNGSITQTTYSGSDKQLWRISSAGSGMYKFSPKSNASYYMAAGDGIFTSDGRNVEMRSSQSDNKDEWVLELVDAYKITFYGISNSGHNHSSCLETVKGNLHDATFNNVTLKTGAISSSDCLSDLKNTNVFTSRSHGHLIVWAGTTTAASTGIILNDEKGTGMVALYSHSWSSMTSGSTSVASTDSFSGLNMVLFIGCETAYDGTTGRNLPAIVSSQGAEVAIGFSETIDCSDANKWTKDFYSYLLEEHTVQEAVDYASGNRSATSGLRSAVVCGNGNYKISE